MGGFTSTLSTNAFPQCEQFDLIVLHNSECFSKVFIANVTVQLFALEQSHYTVLQRLQK